MTKRLERCGSARAGGSSRCWPIGLFVAACGCGTEGGEAAVTTAPPTTFGGDRPVELFVPASYAPGTPAPLLVLLHGYSVSGLVQDLYFGLREPALAHGFLYAHPDGTVDESGRRFWNATDGCCNFDGSPVDDSTYLATLVDDIAAAYDVDPRRVYFVGHSNGGFMSYRMACDHAERVAAIASLAGATFADPTACAPTEPVQVLQIHGTADEDVAYDATPAVDGYPSALVTVETWAGYDGCTLDADTSAPALDLDEGLAGAETSVRRYTSGCDPGGSAELWTLEGGSHLPSLGPAFVPAVLDFLLAHPKP